METDLCIIVKPHGRVRLGVWVMESGVGGDFRTGMEGFAAGRLGELVEMCRVISSITLSDTLTRPFEEHWVTRYCMVDLTYIHCS
jgi:hypothetical protein